MVPTGLYDRLRDQRPTPIGKHNWVGNLRWFAAEDDKPSYTFITFPADECEGELSDGCIKNSRGSRTLFNLSFETGPVEKCVYKPDAVEIDFESARASLRLPFAWYGAILTITPEHNAKPCIVIKDAYASGRVPLVETTAQLTIRDNMAIYRDGRYSIAFSHNGIVKTDNRNGFRVYSLNSGQLLVGIAFNIDERKAVSDANILRTDFADITRQNQCFWEEYLQSCPLAEIAEDFRYFDTYLNQHVTIGKDKIINRQLWHWAILLVNVWKIEFNPYSTYIAPDKAIWYGTWCNDGPDSLCALACTNAHNLARECLVNYVHASIDNDGVLSWYTHSTGQACFNKAGDPGRYSHGSPHIIHAVDYYIRVTGDRSILDADAGTGLTLWDRLKRYVEHVFAQRDINNDGLVEWANLWETGWDDKIGPFFSGTDIKKWVKVVITGTSQDYIKFCSKFRFPVTAINEQCYFLWALRSMVNLCVLKQDRTLANVCNARYTHILNMIRTRHWDKQSRFYYDWDVRNNCLSTSKYLDAFYFLYFETKVSRISGLLTHLENKSEFNLRYVPSLSESDPKFNPDGYWSGGYWPREASYLGLALQQAGYTSKAIEYVIKALCSQEGKSIAENLNPITGANTTRITAMAYSSLLNVVLLELLGQSKCNLFVNTASARDKF